MPVESTDIYEEPHFIHQVAVDLQRVGDTPQARRYFEKILQLPYPVKKQYLAAAYYNLASMEQDICKKLELLGKCLEIEPTHRQARNITDCLTPAMQDRLATAAGRHIRHLFDQPLSVQLQTHSNCNAACIMCPYPESWHKLHPGRMSSAAFTHAVDLLEGFPLDKVCLYLENEPLLDKDLFAKLNYVKSKLKFRLLELSTNGGAFTDTNIQKLHDALIDVPHDIWFSWHGVTKETYEHVMKLDFDRAVRNLRAYLRITQGKLTTQLRSITGGRMHKDQKFSTPEEVQAFFSNILAEEGIELKDSKIRIHTLTFHDRAGNVELGGQKDPAIAAMVGKLKPDCNRLKQWIHVLYDGAMILCCMDYHRETAMLNLAEHQSLEGIYSAPGFLEMAGKFSGQRDSADDFICRRCTSPGG